MTETTTDELLAEAKSACRQWDDHALHLIARLASQLSSYKQENERSARKAFVDGFCEALQWLHAGVPQSEVEWAADAYIEGTLTPRTPNHD